MVDRHLILPIASVIPSLLFLMGFGIASQGVSRYLEDAELNDIRQTDTVHLAQLDADQRRQYLDYRDHLVYPDPAARWVGTERELKELQQWIKQQDMVIQSALAREGSFGKEAESFKKWLH